MRGAKQPARLPFEGQHPDGRRLFWDPRPTGDWHRDCALGQRYAVAAMPLLLSSKGELLLGWIIADMVRYGPEHGLGVAVGFMNAVANHLRRAQHAANHQRRTYREHLDDLARMLRTEEGGRGAVVETTAGAA